MERSGSSGADPAGRIKGGDRVRRTFRGARDSTGWWPVFRIPVCGVCIDEDGGEGGDCADAVVDGQGLRNWARRPGVARENRVEASGLAKDCTRIAVEESGEIGFVGPLAWRTRAEDPVEIFL